MTFPNEQIRDDVRAEDYSDANIAIVSASMIIAAMASLLIVL